MDFQQIQNLLGNDPLPTIRWFQARRLLARYLECEACGEALNWSHCAKSRTDQHAWKCQNRDCHLLKSTVSIRKGSFFARSKLSLQTWVHLM